MVIFQALKNLLMMLLNISPKSGQTKLKDLPSFIFGQSMAGVVALKVHLKQPLALDGTFLVVPMCKIAENVTPP
jgi:caffeoylshikimate esterase